VTANDISNGQIRIPIPGRAKSLLPQAKAQVHVRLRGREVDATYDPRFGPDKERSGILRVGRATVRDLVQPDETLTLSIGADGAIRLD